MSYSGHSDQVVELKIKIKIPDTKEKRNMVESGQVAGVKLKFLHFSTTDLNIRTSLLLLLI